MFFFLEIPGIFLQHCWFILFHFFWLWPFRYWNVLYALQVFKIFYHAKWSSRKEERRFGH